MINKKKWVLMGSLLLVALIIRIFSANPFNTESYYSNGFYPIISVFFRILFGWIPFSIGDLLYGGIAVWIIWKLTIDFKMLFQNKFTGPIFFKKLMDTLIVFLIIYITFNMLWGINYNRQGIATQLGLKMEKYTAADLKTINGVLLEKVNLNKLAVINGANTTVSSTKQIFDGAANAYLEANKKFPFLNYKSFSVKRSMWGWLGNYLGFNGYYNPFTGEAQVNTTVPEFSQPFTTCHEMAHQLGYAKENEANFVGYLSAVSSKDSAFLYSAYLDLFLYADRNLYEIDSTASKNYFNLLLPQVKADIIAWRAFNLRHASAVEPVIRWMYGKFLQSNQQPSGMLSYDEVNAFLVAYYKKYGSL